MSSDRDILTAEELSARWGGEITPYTLANWRALGHGPKYVKLNKKKKESKGKNTRVVYRLKAVEKYERDNEITPKVKR